MAKRPFRTWVLAAHNGQQVGSSRMFSTAEVNAYRGAPSCYTFINEITNSVKNVGACRRGGLRDGAPAPRPCGAQAGSSPRGRAGRRLVAVQGEEEAAPARSAQDGPDDHDRADAEWPAGAAARGEEAEASVMAKRRRKGIRLGSSAEDHNRRADLHARAAERSAEDAIHDATGGRCRDAVSMLTYAYRRFGNREAERRSAGHIGAENTGVIVDRARHAFLDACLPRRR